MRSLVLSPAVLLAACLALTPALHAQEAPSPGGPPPASSAAGEQPVDIGDVQTLKVNVNLVNVYFSVRDKNGYITNLHKDDCQIFEDKAPQKTKNFTQEKNLPLTIGILLDTSGSMQSVLPMEQEAGAEFLKGVLTPKDEAFLISFDINVDLLADYTNSPRELKRALDKASINTGAGTGSVTGNSTPRGTLLYDAVYLAAHDKLHQEAGRKILVLLTDGQDYGSQETIKTAVEAAQKANAIIYVILIADRGFYGGFGYSGAGEMDKLAKETGGRVIDVGNNGKKLQEAFYQIQDELRTQYLASYTPTNLKADGAFRTLNITCGKDMKVQARKGYYALADSSGSE
ncbi:VWA domain-containing protein [Edaphobacter aggregans]|uniref:VWA domain-containing protein n=1 Tax=Edaphobacter aggregans TaxID=570835 RepID=UPI000558B522|nr:VWA domain-containing protein [Edaphobacter aggregans]